MTHVKSYAEGVSYKLMFCCVFTYHFKCHCSVFHVTIKILDTKKMVLTLLTNVYEMTPTKTPVLQYFLKSAPFLEVAMQLRALLRPRVTPYHFVRGEKLL